MRSLVVHVNMQTSRTSGGKEVKLEARGKTEYTRYTIWCKLIKTRIFENWVNVFSSSMTVLLDLRPEQHKEGDSLNHVDIMFFSMIAKVHNTR